MSSTRRSRHVSLDGYLGTKPLSSPRSLDACLRLGIDPSELLAKPRAQVASGVSHTVGNMRWQHFEEHRLSLIRLATVERDRVENAALTSPLGGGDDALSPSPTNGRAPTVTPRSTVRSSHSAMRSPTSAVRDAEASAARIHAIRESLEAKRIAQHEKTEASLVRAEHRRQQHIDAVSDGDVVQRVQEARERWAAQEAAMRRRLAAAEQRKLAYIDQHREVVCDQRAVERMQHSAAKSIRIHDAKQRVTHMTSAKQRRVAKELEADEQRCIAAMQRVEVQRAREAEERRLKLVRTMEHAAQLKAAVEAQKQSEAVELERTLQRKRQAVDARHEALSQTHRKRFVVRRHYFEQGEKIQRTIQRTKVQLSQQAEHSREERLLTARVEREMVLEAKREDSLDRHQRAAQSRRAQAYQRQKLKASFV